MIAGIDYMITGSMVAIVTPMFEDGAIDWDALDALLEWHIAEGTQAIISMGTTGESATLSEQEHCDVIKHTIQKIAGRIFVIAGTGANSTTEAIKLSQCAKDAGADAVLLVTPYYNKPTQEGLFLHHKAIAEAVDIPQILYNVPGRTACDMLPETIAQLAEISNIVGVKEATGDLSRLTALQSLCPSDFALYTGDDATSAQFMLQGGHGTISVTANVAPKAIRLMCDAALAKNETKTQEINDLLKPLHEKLFVESNPIPIKWALYHTGQIPKGIRLPLTYLSKKYHVEVADAIAHASL